MTESHCGAGRRGEDIALAHLSARGFRLLHRNYRHRRGEIDLVMEDPDRVLVFVEVKANRTESKGRPLERIDGRKIARLQRLAQRYCWEFHLEHRDMRFDVVGVELSGTASGPAAAGSAGQAGVRARVEHIPNAFLPDGADYFPSR